ncbi:hypothetical protein BMS3Bbin02_00674 [bacterium BMS3Bbin02]|nr:hypothetical protein BMS3Bbin02_00674 [bacterium BMS3Bbin02]
MKRATFLLLFGLGLTACGSATTVTSSEPAPATNQALAEVPTDLKPGTVNIRTASMADGTQITYGLILPEDFDPAQQYPVLLALPPGGQTVELMVSVAQETYLDEALSRGWVVITPAAPDGVLFFQGSEEYIPELLDQNSWIKPEGDRYHIAGVSNGGRSVFRITSLNPELFRSALVFPGFPDDPSDSAALSELAKIPVAMFVGGDDPGWIAPMNETRDTLESLGGSVTLEVRTGEGHIMTSLSDGVDIFDFLDSARP